MYLRWMVRRDKCGVDFGLWKKIRPSQLVCPIDIHVARVATRFGLLQRKMIDWQAALELTAELRKLDARDPVKYDFAPFCAGCGGKIHLMTDNDIQDAANAFFSMQLIPAVQKPSYELLLEVLENRINTLINDDFPRLVQMLYRADISENELRRLLQTNENNSANMIAVMMIRRELRKMETRKMFKTPGDIPEEEKW